MQKKPVAAEAAFQPSHCADCYQLLGAQRHVCSHCGAPQPMGAAANVFEWLDVPMHFHGLDQTIRAKLLEVTKLLHPDRFAAATNETWKSRALERMSALTRAGRDLQNSSLRRQAILNHFGVEAERTVEALEWGDKWFELDDTQGEIEAFLPQVASRLAALGEERTSLETQWDQSEQPDPSILQMIATKTGLIQTLEALQVDMQRKRS